MFSDDGFFDASRRGQALVAAVQGTRVFAIDQLAPRNNRPDVLYERLGIGDDEIRAHFRTRYERRLRKLGLRPDQLASVFDAAPQAKIVSLRGVPAGRGKVVEVEAELRSQASELSHYQVYVNDVPLLGAVGRPIRGHVQRVKERIELIEGSNRIELAARSVNGIESLRDFRTVHYRRSAKRDLYFLAFGVSHYRDGRLNLAFAHKDALDLGAVVARSKGRHFADVHIHVHVNDQVTVQAIAGAKRLLHGAKVDDTVVLFLAGHGMHTKGARADYFFLTHEANPNDLRKSAASFDLVEGLLGDIAPRRKLLLVDTCESGEREETSEATLSALAVRRGLSPRTPGGTGRGIRIVSQKSRRRPYLLNRERYIYNDLARRTGAIVFSSSRGNEFSYEREDWQNGAFTAEIKLGLTTRAADLDGDGRVTTEELRKYVSAAVARRTGELQHPTIDRDNLETRIELPVVAPPTR
jgi:hypothetical protein